MAQVMGCVGKDNTAYGNADRMKIVPWWKTEIATQMWRRTDTWFRMYLTATVEIGTPCFSDTFFKV
jgi:hypothetical protein